MKSFTFLLLSLAFLVVPSNSQQAKVAVTGIVVEVIPRERPLKSQQPGHTFDVVLNLVFRNLTQDRIIIPRPDKFAGDKKISFLDSMFDGSKIASIVSGIDLNPDWLRTRLINDFLADEPSMSSFAFLEPQGIFESSERIRIDSGYKVDVVSQKHTTNLLRIPRPEYAALSVQYFLSLRDRPENPNLLEAAQRRWSRFGKLILDSNGDYSIKSDPMLNLIVN